ncbi:MAG: hypothetical protein N3E40_05300, partial [Dehalococcoidia bacterium]|nr:hypothetical protein [Dehalococcoidia bacterium]
VIAQTFFKPKPLRMELQQGTGNTTDNIHAGNEKFSEEDLNSPNILGEITGTFNGDQTDRR